MLRKQLKRFGIYLGAGLVGALFFFSAGTFKSGEYSLPPAHAGFFNHDLDTFEEVVNLVSGKYVYPPDYQKIFSSAIGEMVKAHPSDDLRLETVPGGQSLSWKSSRIRISLNYDPDHNLETLRKVYYFLLDEVPGAPPRQELETASIIGIMNALDPYSQYLDKSAFDKSMRDTEGKYGGLGMVITMRDKKLLIVKTMKNGPAERAGILPDDVFLRVNGQKVEGMQIQDLADILRGYPNTKVTLTLLRPTNDQEKTYTLTREIISIETVTYETLEERIGYIRISSFSKQTNHQLKEALRQARKDGVKAFILDLRDNPGGLLNQSVKVASHFLFRNRLIVYTQGRKKEDYKEYRGQYKNSLHRMPVVVLINQHSASASEIVAGALRDSGKALIIGENSYGKGSVQTIFRISDGSGLRLTTSKYFTPSGTDITEHGIVPEIKIVKDILPDSPEQEAHSPPQSPSFAGPIASIRLKGSDVEKFFKEKNPGSGKNPDPVLQFAVGVVRNATVANKNQTLEKARELATSILY